MARRLRKRTKTNGHYKNNQEEKTTKKTVKKIVKPELEIQKTLVASTGHITSKDNDLLNSAAADDNSIVTVYSNEYWHLIYLTTLTHGILSHKGYSNAFKDWCSRAKKLGCDWIKFDRDGEVYEDYSIFNW